jgi:hypothetical protein
MQKPNFTVTTIIVICLLVIVNVVAFNWTSRFFLSRSGVRLLEYGQRIPELKGHTYSGNQVFVDANRPALIMYLTSAGIKGQSIALLKFFETLRQRDQNLFQTTLITSGLLPEVQELLQDDLIRYPIIKDSEGQLAKRLGLDSEESGTFFFDKSGLCRFATRQQINPNDVRQLLTAFDLGEHASSLLMNQSLLSKGKPLPTLSLVDARSLQQVTTNQVSSTSDQTWIFFVADCFACGPPNPSHYLKQFKSWRELARNVVAEPVIIFDSAFLRNDVRVALERLAIKSPAYVANEDLSPFSQFLLSRGRPTRQPLIIRTDSSRSVVSVSLIGATDRADSETTGSKDEHSTYGRIFQNLALDPYDVDSHNGLYYVTDRTRNCIVVINERFEIQRTISGIGSAPGRLFRPGYIDVSKDGLIYVQDGGNERIQSFAADGSYLGGFGTKPYMGMAAGLNGEIYLGQPENGALVSVYSRDGKHLRSIGKLKTYSELMGQEFQDLDEQYNQAANRVRLFVDHEGSVLVSFMLAPLLQKYSPDGKLIFESRLQGPEIEALRKTPGLLTMSMDGFAATVLTLEAVALPTGEINVVLTDGSIYVVDKNGQGQRVFHSQAGQAFTPEMTGISPTGALLVIGLNPRNCYSVSTSQNQKQLQMTKGEV